MQQAGVPTGQRVNPRRTRLRAVLGTRAGLFSDPVSDSRDLI
jgi:hypothetical protein